MDEKFYGKYTLGALVLFFVGGILLMFKPAYDYTMVKNVIGYVFSLVLAVGYIFTKREFSLSKWSLYAFLAFAAWVLAAAFYAGCGYGAGEGLENYILYFLIFIVATQVAIDKKWIYLWLASALVAAAWGLIQNFSSSHYGISSFGNPNFLAGHLLMPLMLALALWRQKKIHGGERFFLVIFALVTVAALIFTKSRAAVFALLFGSAIFLFLIYPPKGRDAWKSIGGLIAVAILLAALWGKIDLWIENNIRSFIWKGTWNLISMRPVTGWGLGNFVFNYPYYRVRTYFMQAESTPVTNHPHDIYLEMWSEIGLVGVVLFLLFVILVLASVRRLPPAETGKKKGRTEKEPCDGLVRIGAVCAVAAVLADNVFSTNLTNSSTAMYFGFLLGILAGTQKVKVSFPAALSRYLWIVVAAAGYVLAVFYSYHRIGSQIFLKNGIWAKDAKDYQEAEKSYRIAVRINPDDYVTWYKLAFVYGEIGDLKKAEEVYQHVTRNLFPHFAKTDANLGTIYLKMNQPEKALMHYRWADWLNPYDKDVLCSVASIYLVCYNDRAKARPFLQRALLVDPWNEYATRVLWSLK